MSNGHGPEEAGPNPESPSSGGGIFSPSNLQRHIDHAPGDGQLDVEVNTEGVGAEVSATTGGPGESTWTFAGWAKYYWDKAKGWGGGGKVSGRW
jgi:hypothetical protein